VVFWILGVLFIVLVAFTLVRIQQLSGSVAKRAPGARWERTDEVIRDPFTGRVVRVWVDPADGSRHYVPERFQFRRRK